MVNKYIRKTNRGFWTDKMMRTVMNEAKTTSISSASKKYGIPIGTLHRHIKKEDSSRFKNVFSIDPVLVQKICDLAIERDMLFYGLTKHSLQQLRRLNLIILCILSHVKKLGRHGLLIFLPSPKVTSNMKKRKERCQKSEILTSSPFKNAIEIKMMKIKPKLVFNRSMKGKENKSKERGICENKEKRKEKEKKQKKINVQNFENSLQNDVFCVLCEEPYVEPPTEDWVQCAGCSGWTHELCTGTEDSSFICVKCCNLLYIPSYPNKLSILPSG